MIAILGNHDVGYNPDSITAALQAQGAHVLINQNMRVSRPGGDFTVAGLGDTGTGHTDFAQAVQGVANDIPLIVISHNPDPFATRPANVWLMFAAHTHCGQVWLPFIGRPVVPSQYGQRYACGRVDENGGTLFVTGGIGTSGLPVRFINWPEVLFVRVRAPTPEELADPSHAP